MASTRPGGAVRVSFWCTFGVIWCTFGARWVYFDAKCIVGVRWEKAHGEFYFPSFSNILFFLRNLRGSEVEIKAVHQSGRHGADSGDTSCPKNFVLGFLLASL